MDTNELVESPFGEAAADIAEAIGVLFTELIVALYATRKLEDEDIKDIMKFAQMGVEEKPKSDFCRFVVEQALEDVSANVSGDFASLLRQRADKRKA